MFFFICYFFGHNVWYGFLCSNLLITLHWLFGLTAQHTGQNIYSTALQTVPANLQSQRSLDSLRGFDFPFWCPFPRVAPTDSFKPPPSSFQPQFSTEHLSYTESGQAFTTSVGLPSWLTLKFMKELY